jgi:dTDP-4-dehydrorhamnose 3,5-epimerase
MICIRTHLDGAVIFDVDRRVDERGFFARTWCRDELAKLELPNSVVQCSISWNERRHTLRGMHWQEHPHGETKLVRCTRGAILDVIVDVRPESPTYLQHLSVELDEHNRRTLLVPAGFAHGFLTLVDGTEVYYQMDAPHAPEAARGARWDDPAFAIPWPAPPAVISERDRTYPDFCATARIASVR